MNIIRQPPSEVDHNIQETKQSKQFPQILQWIKNKSRTSTEWILEFTGKETYQNFQKKFNKRKPIVNSSEFSEMFWNELQIMTRSSNEQEKKYVDGFINRITSQFEDERKHFNDQISEEKKIDDRCYVEVENFINLLEINVNELTNILPYPEHNSFVLNAFQEFKRNIYVKYRRIFTEPHTDSDLISIIQQERSNVRDKVRLEFERIDHMRRIIDYSDDEMPVLVPPYNSQSRIPRLEQVQVRSAPKPYVKNGFFLTLKELKRTQEDKECPICSDTYKEDDIILILNKCKHTFHKKCLEKWSHNTCPVCRAST